MHGIVCCVRLYHRKRFCLFSPIYVEAIGDPNKITDAGIFYTAFAGIDALVELYLNIAQDPDQGILPPDGNTILHIFGHWLFHAAKTPRAGYTSYSAITAANLSFFAGSRKDEPLR